MVVKNFGSYLINSVFLPDFCKKHFKYLYYTPVVGDFSKQWKVRAIRGATTVSENSIAAIREAVNELLDALEADNQIETNEIINVIFSATRDLDAVFPAQIARERPHWHNVPLLDVQQMYVDGSLERSRFLAAIQSLKYLYLTKLSRKSIV